MKKNLFTAIIIGLFFVASNVSFGQERVYNSEKTFSITPAKGWENHSAENAIVFIQGQTEDGRRANIQVRTLPTHWTNDMTFDELWNHWITRVLPRVHRRHFTLKQTGESSINGINANWIEYTYTQRRRQTARTLVYMFIENDIVYLIMSMAPEEHNKNVEADIRRMIYSFRIAE